jgi:hypothetical protein
MLDYITCALAITNALVAIFFVRKNNKLRDQNEELHMRNKSKRAIIDQYIARKVAEEDERLN